MIQLLSARLAGKPPLGTTLKFDFGERKLYLDSQNQISHADKEAACTIAISAADLKALLTGETSPMSAFMSGKIKVQGDMSVAMKLPELLR